MLKILAIWLLAVAAVAAQEDYGDDLYHDSFFRGFGFGHEPEIEPDVTDDEEDSPSDDPTPVEADLTPYYHVRLFKILASIGLIVVVSMKIFYNFRTKPFTDEYVCQVCSEVALILAYVPILVDLFLPIGARKEGKLKIICVVSGILINYFYMAAFAFMALESSILSCFHMRCSLTMCSRKLFYIVLGWGIPAVISGLSTEAFFKHCPGPEGSCWLRYDNGAEEVTFIPVCTMIVMAGISLMSLGIILELNNNSLVEESKNSLLEYKIYFRSHVKRVWKNSLVLILLGASWFTGIFSPNDGYIMMIMWTVVTVLLGGIIFVLRVSIRKVRSDMYQNNNDQQISASTIQPQVETEKEPPNDEKDPPPYFQYEDWNEKQLERPKTAFQDTKNGFRY